MDHPCTIIYNLSSRPVYGDTEGICRITGQKSYGILFEKWIKPTFTDHSFLLPGDIISNQALFCFDEASKEIQQKTKRDKPQRFRTYSHIVQDGEWSCYTKADKAKIVQAIKSGAEIICLTDSGQKHMLFKHKLGMWQLDELFIFPDIDHFTFLHTTMMDIVKMGFTQTSVLAGEYNINYIMKNGFEAWKLNEDKIKKYRGTPMFDFAGWLLYSEK